MQQAAAAVAGVEVDALGVPPSLLEGGDYNYAAAVSAGPRRPAEHLEPDSSPDVCTRQLAPDEPIMVVQVQSESK